MEKLKALILSNLHKNDHAAISEEAEEKQEEIRKLKNTIQGMSIKACNDRIALQKELDKLTQERIESEREESDLRETNRQLQDTFASAERNYAHEIAAWKSKLNEQSKAAQSKPEPQRTSPAVNKKIVNPFGHSVKSANGSSKYSS